ncbi:hypothetical protein [Mucilaginibacter flavidus]|uniref:hypothetical protein n=1 Tax=Mucilaginibacter flavidus TaxID=2949309 RepID=UPI00209371B6|nr:hypothetical protein [Mucilaginibacter flavidus]MCO5950857.1 hypothetical protein [Mucilaginibacter flavidus]
MVNLFNIPIPQSLKADKEGYAFLSWVAGSALLLDCKEIIVDFEACSFIEGNLCAVLGNILEGLKIRNKNVSLQNVRIQILRVLARNEFLEAFGYTFYAPRYFLTSIPYKKFNLSDEAAAKEFFSLELFGKPGMPQMSAPAKKAILRNIFEICINAITHAGCEYVYCCGQLFNIKANPKVLITFVDLGNTITANVNNYLSKNLSGNEAIRWALIDGNTTKEGSEPGGLGLKLLQDLISYNKGKLQIVSGNGFVEIFDGKVNFIGQELDFPGTIVTLEIKLGDPNFYILTNEKQNTSNIF